MKIMSNVILIADINVDVFEELFNINYVYYKCYQSKCSLCRDISGYSGALASPSTCLVPSV